MRLIKYFLLGTIVSMYFFSFGFTFLPEQINTKLIFAVLGVCLAVFRSIQAGVVEINSKLIAAICFAVVFSAIGYFSMDYNYSSDSSYATYIISFSVWMFAGYFVIICLGTVHDKVDFVLLTYYLVAACVAQCFLALVIDNSPIVKTVVDRYIEQGQTFLNDIGRLYGVGASLDNAGVRFSIVLLMLSAVLINSWKVQKDTLMLLLFLSAFIVIITVGNIIARTTSAGAALALIYLFFGTGVWRFLMKKQLVKLYLFFVLILVIVAFLANYLYKTNDVFHDYMRFAFEGFFNWMEKGEWKTSSTDRLNSVMWIWPDANDYKTWLIGKATFDDWHAVGTDIGYCRFVFYNGLLGLFTFSLFFVYNAWACSQLLPGYALFFLFLLALGFVIWLKVATDLFLIYALFYNIGNRERSTR
ncbi:hypothetical protein ORI89_02645 [Sphingobacterium sp. UT-1RO-CII-1]|uniref:hypothetical protein n=1 Tax=Sphingobacterium sp. UT-1RO-CII-1 TaxID=2995225 RepID=UPI00227C8DFB|nr:hypothetical protein [Sphingobacterium sp. UT-1RO-CII-1]MCY4778533.1 hypothetical protein [Sphingobacterium sp. UT-1RO-CII-1]